MEITTSIEATETFKLIFIKKLGGPISLNFVMAEENSEWKIQNLNIHTIATEYSTTLYHLSTYHLGRSELGLRPDEMQEILNRYWPEKYGQAPIIPIAD